MGDVPAPADPYGAGMTTASVRTGSQVAPLPVAFVRLGVLLACLAVSLGMWWAFAQVVLHVIS
jgi:hypothetical protein